ncbi:MAG: M56 family metallopeptidase [Rhodothermales bacterium]
MNLPLDLTFLARFGEAALAGYWMPQLVWAMLAGAVLLALRFIRMPQPLPGYQLVTALLLALPVGLLLAPLTRFEIAAPWTWSAQPEGPASGISIGTLLAAGEAQAAPAWTLNHTIGLFTLLMAALAGFQLAIVCRRLVDLRRLRDALAVTAPAEATRRLEALRRKWNVQVPVALFVTPHEHSPVTFGWRRPAIVLPVSLLEEPDALDMTLEHELIHVAHRDFARGVLESVVRSLFFINPAVHAVSQRIERLRELSCDAELLNQPAFSRKRYASLLARFALRPEAQQRLAVHMSSAGRLKERVEALRAYRGAPASPRIVRALALGTAGAFFFLGIAAMGCEVTFDQSLTVNQLEDEDGTAALTRTPAEPAAAEHLKLVPSDEVFMVVEEMPVLVGGLRSLQESIQYPDIARRAGIEGRVFIQFVVDNQGRVIDPTVVRGIGGGCDEEAIRAVSQARFAPGRQRGVPVAVKMSIPITFKLEDAPAAP